MEWWKLNNQRLIQTNLRAKDAALDRDILLQDVINLHANVLLLNTGGIVAFYPTDLPFHYKSPSLGSGDLTGDMVQRCHDNNIRFIARFDFSKIHESIYLEHPDWAYRSISGESVNYNGFVHSCVNSEYQREKSLEILKEVLELYPIDGVFFNMFGYFTRDYSHVYHGICQCDRCKSLFFERYRLDLPTVEDPSDQVFQTYQHFKDETIHEVLHSIRSVVKSYGKHIAISTYTDDCVDIIKNESNTEIHRAYPLWEYSASENIQTVEGTWAEKVVSNVCINAIGIDYRFQGVPTAQVKVRLAQALSSGSGMDFCIIGVFKDYPDRKNLHAVGEFYSYHAATEKYYGNFEVLDDVLLIKPGPHPSTGQMDEYFGLFRMLKEEHICFRVVEQRALAPYHIGTCSLVICPDIVVESNIMQILKSSGKPILWTGSKWAETMEPDFLSMFEILKGKIELESRWSYVRNSPKDLFPSLEATDWTMLDGPIVELNPITGSHPFLEHLSSGTFGPPELCQGNDSNGTFLGNISSDKTRQLLAIRLGSLYKLYGYPEHKFLVMDRVRAVVTQPFIHLSAFEQVEISVGVYPKDGPASYIVNLINLSGFNGSTFYDPLPIQNIRLTLSLKEEEIVLKAFSLISDKNIEYTYNENNLKINLDLIGTYEAVVIQCARK